MNRVELIQSQEYVQTGIQLNLLNMLEAYMQKHTLKRKELGNKLGVSKGYVTQIMNASYDHKISKLVQLALACDKIPLVFFVDKSEYIENDKKDKLYTLMPMQREKNVSFSNIPITNDFSYVDNNEKELDIIPIEGNFIIA